MAILDSAIARFLAPLIEKRKWTPGPTYEENSGHAGREFTCGHVLIRVANDRGLIDLELGSIESNSSPRSASAFRDLLDPPTLRQWNLGLAVAPFIDEHWDEIVTLLAPDKWQATIERIDERSRTLAGLG